MRDKIMRLLRAELDRQQADAKSRGELTVSVEHDDGWETYVDGFIDMDGLALAAIDAIAPKLNQTPSAEGHEAMTPYQRRRCIEELVKVLPLPVDAHINQYAEQKLPKPSWTWLSARLG
jgi:hypothetical protein